MFRKAIIAFSLAAVSAASVLAQSSGDDYKKGEFYVGYSNGQVDTGVDSGNSALDFFRDRENFNGVNVSGVYNVSRFIGIKGDVSGTYNKDRFSGTFPSPNGGITIGGENTNSLYNFVGGVQIKDNSNEGRIKPFGHVMAGLGHFRTKVGDYTCSGTDCPTFLPPSETFTENGFSAVIGGGIDFRLNNRVQIRAIQVDYNPVRVEGTTLNNIRLGAGIVF
jgi:hypothetical protein